MSDPAHLKVLQQGVDAWNAWRAKELFVANLSGADLRGADLNGANLSVAHLDGADFSEAKLREAKLSGAWIVGARFRNADLNHADFNISNLNETDFSGADLRRANLYGTDLIGANLRNANLNYVNLVYANLADADLTGCHIHGISAWGIKSTENTAQQNLVITASDEPEITVDNIEIAQFIYLLLNNEKIRAIIDTVGKKAVLILGRFTPERKRVLDALRTGLRERNYLPILFDFEKPASKDLTGTVLTLAHMARFVIADLTDPSCLPYEVAKVIPDAYVPVQPILLSGKNEFAMFRDLQRRYHWVLSTHHYNSQEQLITDLEARVICPAEAKFLEIRGSQTG